MIKHIIALVPFELSFTVNATQFPNIIGKDHIRIGNKRKLIEIINALHSFQSKLLLRLTTSRTVWRSQ